MFNFLFGKKVKSCNHTDVVLKRLKKFTLKPIEPTDIIRCNEVYTHQRCIKCGREVYKAYDEFGDSYEMDPITKGATK